MTQNTSALACIDTNTFPALGNPDALREVMEANIGEGEQIGFSDLVRIKMPSGDMQAFMVPSMETGAMDIVKEITGIILHWHTQRGFWPKSISEGGDPQPLCYSRDGMIGEGDPMQNGNPGTFRCEDCPNSKYESAPDGKRQWCKLMRRLYIIRPGEMLPTILTLPPSSIKPCRQFLTQLTSRQTPYYFVSTGIGLNSAEATRTNDKGKEQKIAYMKASFRIAGVMDEQQKQTMRAYRDMILPFLMQFSQKDIPSAEDASAE